MFSNVTWTELICNSELILDLDKQVCFSSLQFLLPKTWSFTLFNQNWHFGSMSASDILQRFIYSFISILQRTELHKNIRCFLYSFQSGERWNDIKKKNQDSDCLPSLTWEDIPSDFFLNGVALVMSWCQTHQCCLRAFQIEEQQNQQAQIVYENNCRNAQAQHYIVIPAVKGSCKTVSCISFLFHCFIQTQTLLCT